MWRSIFLMKEIPIAFILDKIKINRKMLALVKEANIVKFS
jgi:hypothetical protein